MWQIARLTEASATEIHPALPSAGEAAASVSSSATSQTSAVQSRSPSCDCSPATCAQPQAPLQPVNSTKRLGLPSTHDQSAAVVTRQLVPAAAVGRADNQSGGDLAPGGSRSPRRTRAAAGRPRDGRAEHGVGRTPVGDHADQLPREGQLAAAAQPLPQAGRSAQRQLELAAQPARRGEVQHRGAAAQDTAQRGAGGGARRGRRLTAGTRQRRRRPRGRLRAPRCRGPPAARRAARRSLAPTPTAPRSTAPRRRPTAAEAAARQSGSRPAGSGQRWEGGGRYPGAVDAAPDPAPQPQPPAAVPADPRHLRHAPGPERGETAAVAKRGVGSARTSGAPLQTSIWRSRSAGRVRASHRRRVAPPPPSARARRPPHSAPPTSAAGASARAALGGGGRWRGGLGRGAVGGRGDSRRGRSGGSRRSARADAIRSLTGRGGQQGPQPPPGAAGGSSGGEKIRSMLCEANGGNC